MITKFSADNERYLEQAIAGGVYRDRAEAIDEALVLLKRRDQLRGDVRAAIEQADQKLLEADAVFQRLLERARPTSTDRRKKSHYYEFASQVRFARPRARLAEVLSK